MSVGQFQKLMSVALEDFSIGNDGHFRGYCDSEEKIDDLLTNLNCIGYSYSVRNSHSMDKLTAVDKRAPPRYFFHLEKGMVPIPFFGSAFQVEGLSHRKCILGPNYHERKDFNIPEHLADHVIPKRKRNWIIPTRKIGCPATFLIKCIRVYPSCSIRSTNVHIWFKKKALDKLKEDLRSPDKPVSFLRFYVVASPPNDHTHDTESVKAAGDVHPLVTNEIINHVKNGITSTKVIKLNLQEFVNKHFSAETKPDVTNTMFYPTTRTIYNHVYTALLKLKKMPNDLDILQDVPSSSDETNDIIIETNGNISKANDNSIPETSSSCSSLQEKARELVKNISNLTYNCNDETLKILIDHLEDVKCWLELSSLVNINLPIAVPSASKT